LGSNRHIEIDGFGNEHRHSCVPGTFNRSGIGSEQSHSLLRVVPAYRSLHLDDDWSLSNTAT
jgi:hypothetical protein